MYVIRFYFLKATWKRVSILSWSCDFWKIARYRNTCLWYRDKLLLDFICYWSRYQRVADKFLTSWWNNEFSSVSLLPVQFSLSFFSTPYETKTTTTRHGTGKTNNVEFRYWKWKTEIEIYRRIDVPRLYVQMKSTWADKWNPLTGKIYVCQFSGLAGEKKRIAESRFGFSSEIPNKIHETTDRSARVPLSEMCLKFEKTFRTIS